MIYRGPGVKRKQSSVPWGSQRSSMLLNYKSIIVSREGRGDVGGKITKAVESLCKSLAETRILADCSAAVLIRFPKGSN